MDITKLKNRIVDEILIDEDIQIPEDLKKKSRILDLKDVHFTGKLSISYEDDYLLTGLLLGVMILEDDITLEEIERPFEIEIEENIQIYEENNQNTLDIMEVLWQNIVVDVPLRVTNSEIKDIKLQGQGWKVIPEDDLTLGDNLSLGELLEDVRKE